MKNKIVLFLLLYSSLSFGQFMQEGYLSSTENNVTEISSSENIVERAFKEDLKKKYSDKDFQYKEDDEKPKEKEETTTNDTAFINGIIFFISKIFPFILGGIIILIILKTFLGTEVNFWNFKKTQKKVAEKLVYEDEDIHETDLDALLNKALNHKDYRLAIRYYYLSILKTLSNKKLIDYHKDKTNSEYLFEIENLTTRSEFSYLTYVYTYIWYGDFPIDEANFKIAENKYQSFKTSLK